jgi:hypothetical protein
VSGQDYEYRRTWIHERERALAGLFGIDVAFHSELSNHLHVILRTRPDVVQDWSDEEVVRRWLTISKLTRHLDETPLELSDAEVRLKLGDAAAVAEYRQRLSSVSWFMASLCEYIARRANREEGVTGHFWEGRFGCRELIDEASILVCGVYVDLNQIRAGEAPTPEASRYSSAFDRIEGWKERSARAALASSPFSLPALGKHGTTSTKMPADGWLCELTLEEGPRADVRAGLGSSTPWRASDKGLLSVRLAEYLSLLDWTGRVLRADKCGSIPAHLAPILERLEVQAGLFVDAVRHFDRWFGRAVGRLAGLVEITSRTGSRSSSLKGMERCAAVFG